MTSYTQSGNHALPIGGSIVQSEGIVSTLFPCQNGIENGDESSGTTIASLPHGKLAIIDDRILLGECLKLNLQSSLGIPVDAYSSVSAMADRQHEAVPKLVMISIDILRKPDIQNTIRNVSVCAPGVPIVVLSYSRELQIVREVMAYGIRGYILMTTGYDIVVEAVRFVLAGGTYISAECIITSESVAPRLLQATHLYGRTEGWQ